MLQQAGMVTWLAAGRFLLGCNVASSTRREPNLNELIDHARSTGGLAAAASRQQIVCACKGMV